MAHRRGDRPEDPRARLPRQVHRAAAGAADRRLALRVFFIGAHLPLAGHSVRAPTVVIREALRAFRTLGHEVVFQPLLARESEEGVEEEGVLAVEWARGEGIEVLPELWARPDAIGETPRRLVRQSLSRRVADFYPAYALREETAARVDASGADVVFHLWTSAGFPACADVTKPVFAYAGNPDHYSMAARLKHPDLFGIPRETLRNRTKLALWRRAYDNFEHVVVDLALRSTWIGCASAPNADYYTAHGHPQSFYLQNMWPRMHGFADLPEPSGNTIIGNIGGQYATGNTFGLWFLARDILPELDARLGDDYEIVLGGAGQLAPPLARALQHPRVSNRGYLEDVDADLRAAKVFLLANNNDPDFIVGHTRILHAWSLGSCLVAHRNMAVAMPEIEHGANALLAESGAEFAEHVTTLLRDEELRRHIAQGGRDTWEREFLPEVVVSRVVERISAGT